MAESTPEPEVSATPTKRTGSGKIKKATKRRTAKRKKAVAKKAHGRSRGRPKGGTTPFPTTTFEDALSLAQAIQEHAAGQKIRRLTLFEKLDKSPESGPSRRMVTNSAKYGISTGSYQAEHLELTPAGSTATSPDANPKERLQARFDLAIRNVSAFSHLYDQFAGKRLPSPEVLRDSLSEAKIPPEMRKECAELFLENAKFLGLLRTIGGAERLLPIEHVLEESPEDPSNRILEVPALPGIDVRRDRVAARPAGRNWKKTCFVIMPIGEEGAEDRKHADMILESLIERALEREDLDIVRADRIGDPGLISGQVIEYLLKSALVVADLSFHNPNVFYELAIRHMTGRPTVHIIRREDVIPFDVKDFRTILVDTRDKYDLVAKLDTYRAEIANHVRIALSTGSEGSNPIRVHAKDTIRFASTDDA